MFESPFLCISEKDDNPLIEPFMEHIRLKYINSVYILIFMYHIFNLLRNNFIHCINTAADQQREYVGSVLLRREQLAKKREEDASDLGKLTHQYSKIIKERGEDTISIISAVLHRYAEESIIFDVKHFHKMLRKALKLENSL